jgi:hypothetical protein
MTRTLLQARGYDCPKFTNPADFIFMNILNHNKDSQQQQGETPSAVSLEDILRQWPETAEGKAVAARVASAGSDQLALKQDLQVDVSPPASLVKEASVLAVRAWRNMVGTA